MQREKLDGRTVRLLAVMLFGTFIAMLNQTVIAPALPSIMTDLGIQASQGQLLTTIFSLVTGIMVPTTAFMFSRFRIRPLFITAMAVFTAGSYLAAFSGSYGMLLAARVLQAMGVGVLMSMIQFVIMRAFPQGRRGAAMGIVGIVCAAAPAVGPVMAGAIVDKLGWNAVFMVIAPLATLDVILALIMMKNPKEIETDKSVRLDGFSVVCSVVGFGGLLYGFSFAPDYGWGSAPVLAGLIAGVAFLAVFAARQLRAKRPFLDLNVLRSRDFTVSMVIGLILNAILLALMTILPIYMQSIAGFSALVTGAMMVPGAVVMAVVSPFSGRIYDRRGPRGLSIVGLLILCATVTGLVFVGERTSFAYICAMYTVWMLSLALLIMPMTTWGLNSLAPGLMAHGTALYNTVKTIAGALGTAILVLIMTLVSRSAAERGAAAADLLGVRWAFAAAAAACVFSLILGLLFVRRRKPAEEAPEADMADVAAEATAAESPETAPAASEATEEEAPAGAGD